MSSCLSYASWLRENRERLDALWRIAAVKLAIDPRNRVAEKHWLYQQYRKENNQ